MIIFIAIMIFLYGMVFTSFFEVVGSRLPKSESLNGRSHCDHCHHSLRFMDVLPIIGYVINRGKCRYCHQPIPWYHPFIEIGGGLLYVLGYIYYGFEPSFWIYIILLSVLLIESLSDIYHRVVIDRVWMIGLIPLVVIRIIEQEFFTYLLSSTVMFFGLFILSWVAEKLFKKEALGGGDIKLYAFIGFLLPLPLAFISLFIASTTGLIFVMVHRDNQDKYIPLVPFICIGVLISFIFGNALIQGYLSWIGM